MFLYAHPLTGACACPIKAAFCSLGGAAELGKDAAEDHDPCRTK